MASVRRTVVTFDGTTLDPSVYVVSDLRMPLMPRKVESVVVPGADGALFAGANLAEKVIGLTIAVKGATPALRDSNRAALVKLLDVPEPRPLGIGPNGVAPDKFWMALPVAAADGDRYRNAEVYPAEFRVFDPYRYGAERSETVRGTGDISGSGGHTIRGDYPALPVIELTGVNNSSFGYFRMRGRLDGGQDFMDVQVTLPDGVTDATLTIDSAHRVMRLNGAVTALPPALDWPQLVPGSVTFNFNGTCAGTVKYKPRYA